MNRWVAARICVLFHTCLVFESHVKSRQDRYVRMRQIYETIDRQSYQWIVVLVAGLGFFLDGYTVRAGDKRINICE